MMEKITKKKKRENVVKAAVMTAAASSAMAVPVFADVGEVTQDSINTLLEQVFTIAFALISAAIALKGAFMLVPAVQSYLDGVSSQSGDQKREAGTNIGIAIATLLLAGMIFMLKEPIMEAFGLSGSSS